ncbi:MAG: ROK family protein [Acidimicrobiales bacterium]
MTPYAGIELGGTKCVLAIGDGSEDGWVATVIATTDPGRTIKAATEWFRGAQGGSSTMVSLGVACFGPLEPVSGVIARATPKTAWASWPVRESFEKALGVPVKLDTDVNAAALAEWSWGAAQGCSDMLYVTVGTGIGVGAIANGLLVHGRSHPEMGHMRFPQHSSDCVPGAPEQMWGGNCPFHGNCWEGLASGPAKEKRAELWALAGLEPPDEALLESEYVSLGLANLISSYRPQRVVLGGGVLHDPALLPRIRQRMPELLNTAYFPEARHIEDLVVAPALGDGAGVAGAILLAAQLRPGRLKYRPITRLNPQIQTALAQI